MKKDPSLEQTAAGLSTTQGIPTSLNFSNQEIGTLRELGKKVAELASRPVEKEKQELWIRHNDLDATVRPLVFCDPENGWNEIITQDKIFCSDPLARVWEMHLRKEIFWAEEFQDDKVIEPYFNVPYNYKDTGWGLAEKKIGGENGGSYTWEAPIKNYEADLPKLRYPEIIVDYEQTYQILELAETIFDGILPVRLRGIWWWTLGLTWEFINLRGLENFMLDLYDNPDGVHQLMAFLRDGQLRKLDFLETNNLLALNTEGSYVGSGGFGWTRGLPAEGFDFNRVRAKDMWGFCDSQETVGVSATMFEEFVFTYQLPILSRFGLNCYGCCEPMDPRWQVVKKAPRLRRVSVSPWANREKMAEFLNKDYILSLKPKPTPLAMPIMDEGSVRDALRKDLRLTKNCIVEVIMKDNHSLGGNPNNAIRWCRIAKEEAENI